MGWGPVEASVEWIGEEAPALAILSFCQVAGEAWSMGVSWSETTESWGRMNYVGGGPWEG